MNNNTELFISTLRSDNTKDSYRKDLKAMFEYVAKSETEIGLADLLEWVSSMNANGLATSTIARRIGTVKKYFDFLIEIDVVDKSPAKRLTPPKIVNRVEPTLTIEDINNMLSCTTNARDRAIITMLASTGVRISELINITLKDIEGDYIHIIGKGSKRRVIHVNGKTKEYLNDYLKVRKNGIDNLFVSNQHTPMSADSVNRTLKMLANKANVNKNVHNHSFRHLFATNMLDYNVPIEQIQLCLGHSNITTTTRYAKIRNEREVVREVMNIEVF